MNIRLSLFGSYCIEQSRIWLLTSSLIEIASLLGLLGTLFVLSQAESHQFDTSGTLRAARDRDRNARQ
jgi:hypothetical protein